MAGDRTLVRSDKFLWGARLIELAFTIAILAVTGQGASLWKSIDCDIPSKLAFNIAAAGLTLPLLIYLVFSSGSKSFQLLPWHHRAVVTIDGFLVIIWIAAAATSIYDCNGVCSACSSSGALVDEGYGFWVQYGSLFCMCYFEGIDAKLLRSRHRARTLLEGRATSPSNSGGSRSTAALAEKSINIAAKRGLDIVMIFLFLTTLTRAIQLVRRTRAKPEAEDPHAAAASSTDDDDDGVHSEKPNGQTATHDKPGAIITTTEHQAESIGDWTQQVGGNVNV